MHTTIDISRNGDKVCMDINDGHPWADHHLTMTPDIAVEIATRLLCVVAFIKEDNHDHQD